MIPFEDGGYNVHRIVGGTGEAEGCLGPRQFEVPPKVGAKISTTHSSPSMGQVGGALSLRKFFSDIAIVLMSQPGRLRAEELLILIPRIRIVTAEVPKF